MSGTCPFILKTGVIKNSLLNPYRAEQTLERLNFETLKALRKTCAYHTPENFLQLS